MTQTLEMIFVNAAGSKVTLQLPDPKDGLTAAEVQSAMQQIVQKNVFATTGGNFTGIAGARIVNREVVDMNVV